MFSQLVQWLRLHASAILVTVIAASHAGAIPNGIGAVAEAVAAMCGASN